MQAKYLSLSHHQQFQEAVERKIDDGLDETAACEFVCDRIEHFEFVEEQVLWRALEQTHAEICAPKP